MERPSGGCLDRIIVAHPTPIGKREMARREAISPA
jgi:hypothetical protein